MVICNLSIGSVQDKIIVIQQCKQIQTIAAQG
jgi:hypothetical protein